MTEQNLISEQPSSLAYPFSGSIALLKSLQENAPKKGIWDVANETKRGPGMQSRLQPIRYNRDENLGSSPKKSVFETNGLASIELMYCEKAL